MDACDSRFGRGAVVPARAGLMEKRIWSTRFEMRPPRLTTRLSEVPAVQAAHQAFHILPAMQIALAELS